jgi:hypothetical protein
MMNCWISAGIPICSRQSPARKTTRNCSVYYIRKLDNYIRKLDIRKQPTVIKAPQ